MIGDVSSLPQIRPMLAVAGELPTPAEQAAWSFEMKWDGVRTLAYVEDGRLELRARSGRDITAAYPELQGLADQLAGQRYILDGEVVAFDDAGRPSFPNLQPRIHVREPLQAAALARERPVVYLVFDLLHLDDTSLLSMPYHVRRETLEQLGLGGARWHMPPVFLGLGDQAYATSTAQGLEGVVAKRLDARYEPGRRSDNWRKVKTTRTQDVVIGGWRPGEGNRAGTVGSLLCGVYDKAGQLHYAGRVGSGFPMAKLREFQERFAALAQDTCPFGDTIPREDARDAFWVAPVLVGEVVFSQWTRDGRLWHPRWKRLREDKPPHEVTRE